MGSCFPQLIQEGRAAMSELTIWTYDWVPEGPRGFVRDLRLGWACEEAGLIYAVRTIPFDGRETNRLAHQPSRATDRASFKKTQADQIGHFEAADQKREEERSS